MNLHKSFEVFGLAVFKAITDKFQRSLETEETDEIAAMAAIPGLMVREPFNPERHGEVPDAEPGQEIWSWAHLEGWEIVPAEKHLTAAEAADFMQLVGLVLDSKQNVGKPILDAAKRVKAILDA